MTVQNVSNTIDFTGNGVATSFPFVFRADDVSWIVVSFTDDFDQVLLNADQEAAPGGSINYTVAPPVGQFIRVTRVVPQAQDLDYERFDAFDSESHEDALDKLTMQVQDLQTLIDGISSTALPVGTFEGSLLRWDNVNLDWDEFLAYQIPLLDGAPNEGLITDGAGTLTFQPFGTTFPLLAPNGSFVAPSYSFLTSPGSGFFLVAPNRWGMALSGAAKFDFNDFNGGTIRGAGAGTAGIRNAIASAVGPNVHANADDSDTGQGWEDDTFIGVSGGQTAIKYPEANSEVQQINSSAVGLVASIVQTQGQGQLESAYNEIAVVANLNDTVTAPTALPGKRLVVINNGANIMQMFPDVGDDLGNGVNAAIFIAIGSILKARGRDGINWDVEQNSGPVGTAFLSGTFLGTLTGFTVPNTGTLNFIRLGTPGAGGAIVYIFLHGAPMLGISNLNAHSLTGLPNSIVGTTSPRDGHILTTWQSTTDRVPSLSQVFPQPSNQIDFSFPNGPWVNTGGGTFSPVGFNPAGIAEGLETGWTISYAID